MAGYTPQLGRQFALQAAQKYGLDPRLFTAQLQQESRFRADAVSPVGARGPGQIMPATWRDPGFGLSFEGNIDDPYANIEAAAKYQRAMLDRYNGDTRKALAAYNWGAGNADNWSGDPAALPEETRSYIASITRNARRGGGGGADVLSLASRSGPVTLADEAAQEPAEPRSIMQQIKEGATFHGGNALQSLGAAIAATSLGESAAPALADIRDQYYAEQEAEFAKQQAEQQRIAMIDMVGADSAFGQALANGADPQVVMQAYMQERGFGHDFDMAAQGFDYDQILQDDQQAYGWETQGREFGQEERMAGLQYDYQRAGAREDADLQRTRDAALHDYALDERYADHGYRRAEQDRGAEIDREAAASEATSAEEAAAQVQEAIALSLEQSGNKAAADAIRNMPVTPFGDNASVETLLATLAGPAANDPTSAIQNWQYAQTLSPEDRASFYDYTKAGGTNINLGDNAGVPGLGKVGPDQGYVRDDQGNFVIDPETNLPRVSALPGSALEAEQKAAAAERQANADKAARAQRAKLDKSGTILDYLKVAREESGNPLATGLFGQLTQGLGGTPANRLKHTLVPLTANIGFEELSNMRQNSPTGGALGSVAVEELRQLQGVLGSLDLEQGSTGLNRSLDKIETHYTNAIKAIASDPNLSAADKSYALTMLGLNDAQQADAMSPPSSPVSVSNKADYDALPSGAMYVDPNGVTRRKQ